MLVSVHGRGCYNSYNRDLRLRERLPEDEIYADFAKIYRKYKAFNRKKVGDYFFAVTEELVEKLCDEGGGMSEQGTEPAKGKSSRTDLP